MNRVLCFVETWIRDEIDGVGLAAGDLQKDNYETTVRWMELRLASKQKVLVRLLFSAWRRKRCADSRRRVRL
jgi:hypothetical protein